MTPVLLLNIVVATIAFAHFGRAGHVRFRLLAPFLVTSVPFAFLGGRFPLRSDWADALLAAALLAAAVRFLLAPRNEGLPKTMHGRSFLAIALALGAVLGFLAGATAIGGGIFLSPILVLAGWATVRQAAGVAGAFIIINSLAGLAGRWPLEAIEFSFMAPLALAVVAGSLAGGFLGARRVSPRALQILLGVVLLAAVARILAGFMID